MLCSLESFIYIICFSMFVALINNKIYNDHKAIYIHYYFLQSLKSYLYEKLLTIISTLGLDLKKSNLLF